MARPLRTDHAGAIHHVTCRANSDRILFHDRTDHLIYLQELRAAGEHVQWLLLGYCLLPNHVHLLVETPYAGLGTGMQRLNGSYARRLHSRHGSYGHVFQGRYKAKLVRMDAHFLMTVAYIARNPVAAGLCAQPGDWPWSSHRAIATRANGLVARDRLVEILDGFGGSGADRYRQLAGDQEARVPLPVQAPRRPRLADALRPGDAASLRSAHFEHGYSVREIAAVTGTSAATVSRHLKTDGSAG